MLIVRSGFVLNTRILVCDMSPFQFGNYLDEIQRVGSLSLRACVLVCRLPKNNLKNGSFRNRENLLYKKAADSVLLSLFMRTNGKCNNCHAPSTG